MSDAFWANLPILLTALGTFLTTAITLWTNRKVHHLAGQVEIVHRATNSMKDELVKVTGESEHARGKLEGALEEYTKGQRSPTDG